MVLDEAHHPSHLDAAFKRKFAVGLHLPTSARVAPRSNFGETGDNDHLLEVDHSLQVLVEGLDLALPIWQFGEVEFHVGSWLHLHFLVHRINVITIDDLAFDSSLLCYGLADLAGLGVLFAKVGHEVLQIGQVLETTIEVGPDRLHLAEIDDCRSHQTKKVEGHFLLREGAHAVPLNPFSNNVVACHQACATSPTDDGTADSEVVAPAFRVPSLE